MPLSVESLLDLFRQGAELTREQVGTYFPGETARDVAKTIHQSRRWTKRLRIVRWITDVPGKKRYPRAVYAMANGKPDAPKPKPLTPSEMTERWRKKNLRAKLNKYGRTVATGIPNSVFDIADARKRAKRLERNS